MQKPDDHPRLHPVEDAVTTVRLLIMVVACFGLAIAIPLMPLGWPWYRYALTSAAAIGAGLALIYLWLRAHRVI
jgi:hypothetical protein